MPKPTSPSAPAAKFTGIRLKRILVPTDFSAASRLALPVAVELAAQFGATLTLIHVFPTSLPAEFSHLGILFEEKRLSRAAAENLASFRKMELPPNLPVETALRAGGPAHEIVRFAKQNETDLVVTSTHGRTGLKHLWLGSTAERIVRHAPCPVLVMREATASARFPGEGVGRFLRIVVPVDFSSAGGGALRYAKALAQTCGGHITLIHVIEPPPYPEFGYARIPAKEARLRRSAKTKLEELARELPADGVPTSSAIRTGSAFHEITTLAREQTADLIVITTHGHGQFARAFLGSTAERVVRHAPCPVLVVREREHEFVTE